MRMCILKMEANILLLQMVNQILLAAFLHLTFLTTQLSSSVETVAVAEVHTEAEPPPSYNEIEKKWSWKEMKLKRNEAVRIFKHKIVILHIVGVWLIKK